jgi:hypothetical protein
MGSFSAVADRTAVPKSGLAVVRVAAMRQAGWDVREWSAGKQMALKAR